MSKKDTARNQITFRVTDKVLSNMQNYANSKNMTLSDVARNGAILYSSGLMKINTDNTSFEDIDKIESAIQAEEQKIKEKKQKRDALKELVDIIIANQKLDEEIEDLKQEIESHKLSTKEDNLSL